MALEYLVTFPMRYADLGHDPAGRCAVMANMTAGKP